MVISGWETFSHPSNFNSLKPKPANERRGHGGWMIY